MATPAPILSLDFASFYLQMHTQYTQDFEKLFNIGADSTLTCTNDHIQPFQLFISTFSAYFRENDILLDHLQLERAGQGQIQVIKANKKKILKLYGIAYHLYMKSCRFLNRQMNPKYGDIVLVKFEASV